MQCSVLKKYNDSLDQLGLILRKKLPEIDFLYDSLSGLWIAEDRTQVSALRKRFDYSMTDYLSQWRDFLGVPDLIVLGHDCELWFAFTCD